MIYQLARFLQLAGLIILPIAIAGEVVPLRLTLRESLSLSALGVTLFIIGWSIQQFVKPK